MIIVSPYRHGGSVPAGPVIAATNTGTDNSTATTSADVQLPAGIQAGELLMIVGGNGGTLTSVAATGWTVLYNGTKQTILYKFASGSEGASVTVSWTGSIKNVWHSVRITGAHASTAPEIASATGNSNAPNPPTLTPSWGSAANLWIATFGAGQNEADTYPAAYTDNRYTEANTTGSANAGIGFATRALTATDDDPAAYGIAETRPWNANTVAVRPA